MLKYLISALIFIALAGLAVYYFVPLVRYVLIPLTGGTQEPTTDTEDLFLGSTWINSSPLSFTKLKSEGKLVLIDFWTYTCINCIRANPHTQQLWERYKDYGLVIVGVHSPEFKAIEADAYNVEQAVKRAGHTYPIIVDSEMRIWDDFANRFWPAKYLINPQGRIVYFHFGEGKYDAEELKVRSELEKLGYTLPAFPESQEPDTHTFLTPISKNVTPELYAGLGFLRRSFGNREQPVKGQDTVFKHPALIEPDRIYLEGTWRGAYDYVESITEGLLYLSYLANAVYIVLAADAPRTVEVLLDGKPIPKDLWGTDIIEQDGKTVMSLVEPRLYYPIAHTAPYGRHTISFKMPPGVKVFAFTFGTY